MARKLVTGVYFLALLGTTGYLSSIVLEAVNAMDQVYSNVEKFADPSYTFNEN